MSKSQLLTGAELWSVIRERSLAARRVRGAVSYFSSAGDEVLPLPRGSRLVVDMSDAAVKSGLTDPAALRRIAHEVELYALDGLHAKILVFDSDCVVVGSMNASLSSSGWDTKSKRYSSPRLAEAAMVSFRPEDVRAAMKLLDCFAAAATAITDEMLASADGLAKERPNIPQVATSQRSPRRSSSDLWIFTASGTFNEQDSEVSERLANEVNEEISSGWTREKYSVTSDSCAFARRLKAGWWIVPNVRSGRGRVFLEPQRVLRIHRGRLRDGRHDLFITEARSPSRSMPASKFNERWTRRFGSGLAVNTTIRQVPPSSAAAVRSWFL